MDSEWFRYINYTMADNTSWSKDTENYPPSGADLIAESSKAVEIYVGITVASDDDTSVEEHDNNYFQFFQYLYSFDIIITVFPPSSLCAFARIAIGY